MDYLLFLMTVTNVGTALWLALVALRNGGLKKELAEADAAIDTLEANVIRLGGELAEARERHKKKLAALRTEIKQLESDIEQCTEPGARRRRIERLFLNATDDR